MDIVRMRKEVLLDDVAVTARQSGLEVRDYQTRVVSKTCNAFLTNHKSVLIESPTGSGKTSMGLISLKILKTIFPEIRFGWVAMRQKLLVQAAEENERVGVRDIEFVSMFESHPPKCDLLVTDEAQHDAAATMATLHKEMGAKWSLGLTATPFRTDRVKLSYEKIIRDCGVRFLIEEGWLSPFDQCVIPHWTPLEIAKQLISNPKRWGKSVVFFQEQKDCWKLHHYLKQYKVNSAVMLGSMHIEKEREPIFDAFDEGKLQVLINVQLLTEGFDCPDLQTVWVRDSGKLCTMQMAGRVLRKDPNNPGKIAQIVQSGETSWPYPKCVNVKPHKQFIWQDNHWRSLEPSDKVEKVMQKTAELRRSKAVVLPGYLTGAEERIVSIRVNKDGKIKKQTAKGLTGDARFLSYDLLKDEKD